MLYYVPAHQSGEDGSTMSDQEFEKFSLMEDFLGNLASLRPQN